MNILVTGGAGFIGSAVIRQLIIDKNISITNIDKLTYAGNLDSLESVSNKDNYNFKQIDICDERALKKIFEEFKPNMIMHLAAESHVDRSIDNPDEFIKTNIIGTFNLLNVSLDYYKNLNKIDKNKFRFHHVSTDEVYGDLGTDGLFTEETPYAPSSPYSASKASSDHLVRAWGRTYNLPIIVSNCSNNYGPFHFPEKLIPHIIINALSGKSLPIYGDGSQIRDWLYVEDHARALINIIFKGTVGETYNIGGHNEMKNIEVVHMVCDYLDDNIDIKPNNINSFSELIIFVKDRPGHDKRYAIDASKIEKDLGWTPQETFESGIKKTIQWYLDNRDWYERILSGDYKLERIGDSHE